MNLASKFIKAIFNFYIIITINISLIIIIICENNNTNPMQITNDFFELNHLASGSKLELDNNIICFYDYDFSKAINKEKNIICLEEYQTIYIFNNKDTYLYKYELGNLQINNQGQNFSLIPYSFENNIYFIITFIYDNHLLNISHYQINENQCLKINSREIEILSNNFELYNCTISLNIQKYLICFFLENQWIYSLTYNIDQNLYNFNKTNISSDYSLESILSIASSSIAINQKKSEILICYCYKYNNDNDKKSQCYFYNIDNESFNKNYTINNCKEFLKAYYFIETNEYIVICRKEGKKINLYRLDENNMKQNFNCSQKDAKDYNCESVKNFLLYYDSNKKEYNLINDCYNNHTFIYLLNITTEKINPIETESNLIANSSEKATTNLIEYNIITINEKRTIDEILSNITDFLKDKKIGENYEVKTEKNIIYIRPSNSTGIIPSKTHLNLSQCESVLRDEYHLNYSILTLFQIEIANKNNESLVNKVGYKIYDENFTELNLSKCKDLNIEVIYGIKKDITVEYDKIIYYQNLGINIFNLSDRFFNDICQIFPDFENDIILEDRIKDIFINLSVCEEGCTYKEFDNNYYTFTCECIIKDYINLNITNIKLEESHIKTNNLLSRKRYKHI